MALLLLVAGTFAAAGCGGGADPEALRTETEDVVGVPPERAEEAAELRRIADRVEETVRQRIEGARESRSVDELTAELEGAAAELREAGEELRALDPPPALAESRDELEEAVGELESELEDARREADAGNLAGAIEELGDLEAVRRVLDAVERVRADAGTTE